MKVKIKTWKELLGTNGAIVHEGSKETVIRVQGYCSFTSIMESSLPKDRIIEIDSNSICLLLHSQYFIEDWMIAEYLEDGDTCKQQTDQYKGKEIKQVQAYEYDGKLFRTEDEVEIYKKTVVSKAIEECIFEYGSIGESIGVKDLCYLLTTFGSENIINDILKTEGKYK